MWLLFIKRRFFDNASVWFIRRQLLFGDALWIMLFIMGLHLTQENRS